VNLVEAAVARQENRIMEEMEQEGAGGSKKDVGKVLMERANVLVGKDFLIGDDQELGAGELEKAAIEKELADLIGMKNVKEFFHKLKVRKRERRAINKPLTNSVLQDTASFVEMTGKMEALGGCLHLILTGNPGTGKTTTARLISRYVEPNPFAEPLALTLPLTSRSTAGTCIRSASCPPPHSRR
jgi:signal recognition particle GTPase